MTRWFKRVHKGMMPAYLAGVLLLSGCGGGGGGDGNVDNLSLAENSSTTTSADAVAPTSQNLIFNTRTDLSLTEGNTGVTVVSAISAAKSQNMLSYFIVTTGDGNKFSINSSTGELAFISPPDYENPTDNNKDNIYHVTIGVSDGNNSATITLNIIVTNVLETIINGTVVTTEKRSLTLNWSAPTERENSMPLLLSEIGGYRIYMGDSKGSMIVIKDIPDAYQSKQLLESLEAGSYFLALTAYDLNNAESPLSTIYTLNIN